MNKIATRIGQTLASELGDTLKRPMNWRMIDALANLQEAEESTVRLKVVPRPRSDN